MKLQLVKSSTDNRHLPRWAPNAFERFELEVRDHAARKHRLQVADVSAFGAKVKNGQAPFEQGQMVTDVRLLYNNREVGSYSAGRVAYISNDKAFMGVVFAAGAAVTRAHHADHNDRASARVKMSGTFAPHAWCVHPMDSSAYLHFQVLDLSLGGARLVCDGAGKPLLRGAELSSVHFLLLAAGEVCVDTKVVAVDRPAQGLPQMVSVKFERPSKQMLHRLARFMLIFDDGQSTLAELRNKGQALKWVRKHVRFSYVQNPEDYQEVLTLRRDAYARAGKVASDAKVETMADEYDDNSVIVCAKAGSNVVGSVRLTYCRTSEERLELDASGVVPDWMPRDSTVEASRLCVSDAFEGTDLVMGLFERAVEITCKLNAKWVITSSVGEMLPFYEKWGFKQIGPQFCLATMNNIPHYLLAFDAENTGRQAKGMNPLNWMFSYSSVMANMAKLNFAKPVHFSPMQRIQIRIGQQIFRLRTGKTLHLPRD